MPEIVWTFGVLTEQEGGSARDCVDIWSTNRTGGWECQRLCGHLEYQLNRRMGVPEIVLTFGVLTEQEGGSATETVWTFGVLTEQEGGSARDCVDIWSTN